MKVTKPNGNEHSTDKRRKIRREQNLQARMRKWGEEEYEKAKEILYSRIEKSSTCKRCDIPGECWNYTGYCQGLEDILKHMVLVVK